MIDTCFVKTITAPINDKTIKSLSIDDLKNVNNYFEVVDGNKPMRIYIDIDGSYYDVNEQEFNDIDTKILNRLISIENTSLLTSSKYSINKLSYRITFFNEIVMNKTECKNMVKQYKLPFIQNLLNDIIEVNDNKKENSLNIDFSVYRTKGKMRCVNAYKDRNDKNRINKLVKGNIDETIISHNYIMDDIDNLETKLETKLEPVNIKNNYENIIITETKKETKTETKSKKKDITNGKIKKYEEMIEKEKEKIKKQEKIKNNEEQTSDSVNDILNEYFLNDYLYSIDIDKLQHTDWVKIVLSYKKCNGSFDKLMKWNKKSKNFDLEGLNKLWNKYSEDENEMSVGTLKYYSKLTNINKYNSIIQTINYTFQIIFKCTEKNIANLYINLNYDNLYVYNDTYYIFKSNRWCSCNNTKFEELRYNCSEILGKYLNDIIYIIKNILLEMDNSENVVEEDYEKFRKMYNKLSEVELLTGKTQWVNNIVREVRSHLLNNQSDIDVFDKKHHLFAFNNVIFDLNTNEQIPFDKKLYITMNSGKNYIEPTKEQIKTIHEIFTSIFPDPEVLKCYLSILRTGLSGYRLEKIVVANGNGRNGKGLINELFEFLLGKYFYKLPVDMLTKEINMMGANPQIANLNNKRFVVCCEPDDKKSMKMHTAKELTGCDTINARGLYETNTITNLLLTFVIEVNQKPSLDGRMDNAILERMLDVPFVNSFTEDEERINNVDCFRLNKKYKHYDFKLNHYCAMFKYILLYAPKELYVPDIIKKRSKEYVMDNDELFMWVDDNYIITNNDEDVIKIKDIFNKYKNSDYYLHLTKRQKRQNNYKNFNDTIKHHIIFKKMYKENKTTINKKTIDCKRLHGIQEKFECDSDNDSDIE